MNRGASRASVAEVGQHPPVRCGHVLHLGREPAVGAGQRPTPPVADHVGDEGRHLGLTGVAGLDPLGAQGERASRALHDDHGGGVGVAVPRQHRADAVRPDPEAGAEDVGSRRRDELVRPFEPVCRAGHRSRAVLDRDPAEAGQQMVEKVAQVSALDLDV